MGLLSFLRRGLFRASNPEDPRYPLNSRNVLAAFRSEAASSGVPVGRETALTFSPWWRGITLVSSYVAKTPLLVYRRRPDGKGKARDPEHAAYRLLLYKPNEYQTANVFRRQMQGHAIAVGNAYAYIVRRGDGAPVELLPLDPGCTFPVRADGRLWYVTEAGVERRKLVPTDVLHLRGFSYDGVLGYSLIDKARETLGLGMGMHKWQTVFYGNNARPGVVLEAPGRLDPKTKVELREGWERLHAGLDNAHRTAVLDQGLKASTLAFTAEDSQFVESRAVNIRDVANFLGVPPHKIGDTSRTAYASLEQENQSFLDDGLDDRFHDWECECREKLLTEAEKEADTHCVEFDRRTLRRANLLDRSNYHRTALGGRPWETQNEAREDMGLDPLDDPKADEVLEPLNMGQGGADNQPAPAAPPPAAAAARPADAAEIARLAALLTAHGIDPRTGERLTP